MSKLKQTKMKYETKKNCNKFRKIISRFRLRFLSVSVTENETRIARAFTNSLIWAYNLCRIGGTPKNWAQKKKKTCITVAEMIQIFFYLNFDNFFLMFTSVPCFITSKNHDPMFSALFIWQFSFYAFRNQMNVTDFYGFSNDRRKK